MINLKELTIKRARTLLDKKDISTKELTKFYLDQIEKHDGDIHAYLEVFDDVLYQAEKAQERINKGDQEMLTGIPLAYKDNMLLEGRVASAGSKILDKFRAPYSATALQRIKDSGGIFLGRTNMDEFAMGSSTENSAFGVTKNPFDTSRVPGGSSGGSAAAIAIDAALFTLGSDTGGSIRQPASFCGCVGLKPTYGAVSRYGLIAMASSFDQIGPLSRTVDDARIVFDAVKGTDPMDSTSYYPDEAPSVPASIRVGIPRDVLDMDGLDEEVRNNFESSVEKLKNLGFELKDITLPSLKYALAVYYIIVPAEISSNLARFDGVRFGLKVPGDDLLEDYFRTRQDGFGEEVRRRILLGTYVLSAGYYDSFYGKAESVRQIIADDFKRVLSEVDIVAMPVVPTLPFSLGEKVDDPLQMYLADIFTVPANVAGVPAISIPSGFSSAHGNKLPFGIQFIARPYEEETLFSIGEKFLQE